MSEPSITTPDDGTDDVPNNTTGEVPESDKHIIDRADANIREECLLAAARLLHQVTDETLLTAAHRQVLDVAKDMEDSASDLLHDPDASWIKQSETKSNGKNRDTKIYYKVTDAAKLECRVDCVVESSLLVPLLAVFNETSLYDTWIPSWTFPVTLGIQDSTQLKQLSRGHQIVHITANVPWPMATRDVVLRAIAADDIAAHNAIVVRMMGMSAFEDEVVPTPLDDVVRADFEGAILIRSLPGSQQSSNGNKKGDSNEIPVLVSFKMFIDPHLTSVPTSVINFVTRTVIGTMWKMLLQVAEGIRVGSRPLHEKAIQDRSDLYQWIRTRIEILLQGAAVTCIN